MESLKWERSIRSSSLRWRSRKVPHISSHVVVSLRIVSSIRANLTRRMSRLSVWNNWRPSSRLGRTKPQILQRSQRRPAPKAVRAVDLPLPKAQVTQGRSLSWPIRTSSRRSWRVTTLGLWSSTLLGYCVLYSVWSLPQFLALIQQITKADWKESPYLSYWRQQEPAIHGQVSGQRLPDCPPLRYWE